MSTQPTYVIRRTRFFYGPSVKRDLLSSDGQQADNFDTPAAARGFIGQVEAEVYHLSHNEAGRPEYKVVRTDLLPSYLLNLL